MSYDIYLRPPPAGDPCPSCGRRGGGGEPERLNPTRNLVSIFRAALTPDADIDSDVPYGIRSLDGRKAIDTLEQLRAALVRVCDPAQEERFRALEALNGWGTLEDGRRVIWWLVEYAEQYPDNTWEVR